MTRELLRFPDVQIDDLVNEKMYRIHIPMDLYIKLGQRKKNLIEPKAGPVITSEEVMAEIVQ